MFAGMTLWQGMLEAFADLRRLEAELQELAQCLHYAEVLPRYSALQPEQVHALAKEYGKLEQSIAGLWWEWEELGGVLEVG